MVSSCHPLLEEAANFEDPVKRIAGTAFALLTIHNASKIRKKKPFNPMLGETFEFVTDSCRYIGEKV